MNRDDEDQQQLAGYDEALEVVNEMAQGLRRQIVGSRHGVTPDVDRGYTGVRAVIETMEAHRKRVYGSTSGITDATPEELREHDERLQDSVIEPT